MDTENRPVLTGLVALVGVAVVIGLLGGLAVIGRGQGHRHRRHHRPPVTTPAPRRRSDLPKPTDTSSEIPEPEDSVEPSAGRVDLVGGPRGGHLAHRRRSSR